MDDILLHHRRNSAGNGASLAHATCDTTVYFIRAELTQILNIYGRLVAAGEWRDYAIDHLKDQAVFSIFRRASEVPHYRLIKEPALANLQGAWKILGTNGQTLKRGKELKALLRYFDRHLLKGVTPITPD